METMKAVRIHDFGAVDDVLRLDDVPRPRPADDEVLVRVHAASVNPVDAKMRAGAIAGMDRERLPITLGRDFSGVIEQCGKSVGYFQVGDAVYAMVEPEQGAQAEYVAVKAALCTLKPANIGHVEAAALPLAALTAYQGLFEQGHLQAKQRVLIHGGAGGVGHVAIQMAKAKGALVCTTVGGDDMQFASELGADEAVDYHEERFEETLQPVDLVFDLIGGETQARSWNLLKRGGGMVSTLSEPSPERAREHKARASVFWTRPNGSQLAEVSRLIETDELRPLVARTFTLDRIAEAHTALEQKHTRGKIVIKVR